MRRQFIQLRTFQFKRMSSLTTITAGSSSASDGTLNFSTCEISDALLKLGIPHGGHIPDIEMVSPSLHRVWKELEGVEQGEPEQTAESFKLCGPAFTVRIVDARLPNEPPNEKMEGHFVDQIEEGSVVVVEAPPYLKNAVWGGLMTAGAQSHGARGVVISGRCRDLVEHQTARFPVFARGHSTLGSNPFTRATNVQIPIIIRPIDLSGSLSFMDSTTELLEGVTVRPGDWIVADIDGVVCVPQELVGRVKELAGAGRTVDAHCLEDIRAGKGVEASFKTWRGTGTTTNKKQN